MNGRDKRRRRAQRAQKPKSPCPSCGEMTTGHFVPPSLGESGYYICQSSLGTRAFWPLPELNYRTVDYRGRGA